MFQRSNRKIQKELIVINDKLKSEKDKAQVENLRNKKLRLNTQIAQFFVPISFYNAKSSLIKGNIDIPFADIEYDSKKGVTKKNVVIL